MPRLLVVDDSEDTLRLLSLLLSSRGYQVDGAPNATDALRLAQQLPPDVLITDCALSPGASGIHLARALRGYYPSLPVIVVSGYEGVHLEQRLEGFDVSCTFTKPVEISKLCEHLQQVAPLEPGPGVDSAR